MKSVAGLCLRLWTARARPPREAQDAAVLDQAIVKQVRDNHAKGKRSAQRATRAEATGIEAEIERREIAAKSPAAKRVAQHTDAESEPRVLQANRPTGQPEKAA